MSPTLDEVDEPVFVDAEAKKLWDAAGTESDAPPRIVSGSAKRETKASLVRKNSEKMAEARNELRGMWGERYAELIKPTIAVIKSVMRKNKIGAIQAAVELQKEAEAQGRWSPGLQLAVLSAACDVAEGA